MKKSKCLQKFKSTNSTLENQNEEVCHVQHELFSSGITQQLWIRYSTDHSGKLRRLLLTVERSGVYQRYASMLIPHQIRLECAGIQTPTPPKKKNCSSALEKNKKRFPNAGLDPDLHIRDAELQTSFQRSLGKEKTRSWQAGDTEERGALNPVRGARLGREELQAGPLCRNPVSAEDRSERSLAGDYQRRRARLQTTQQECAQILPI